MKTTLRYVGNFIELGRDDYPNAPSLVLSRGRRGVAMKKHVITYLRTGVILTFSPGLEDDIFNPRRLADSASVLTDGVYAWQKALAYYVEEYDVALPAEFELHMERNRWTIPTGIEKQKLELPGTRR